MKDVQHVECAEKQSAILSTLTMLRSWRGPVHLQSLSLGHPVSFVLVYRCLKYRYTDASPELHSGNVYQIVAKGTVSPAAKDRKTSVRVDRAQGTKNHGAAYRAPPALWNCVKGLGAAEISTECLINLQTQCKNNQKSQNPGMNINIAMLVQSLTNAEKKH